MYVLVAGRMEDAMKLPWRMLSLVLCASATLAGCASNVAPTWSAVGPGVDERRVAQVEAAARRAGVEVHWVNYPRKTGQ
jgi:hypothetical protein